MRSSRRCAGFAATVGLAGSLVMSASVASSATATEDVGRAGAPGQVRSGAPVPRQVGPLAQPGDGYGDHDERRVCRGLVPYPIPEAYRAYFFCGDWRLGPRHLPTHGLLGHILRGYDRLGGLTAVQFLHEWWNPALDSGQGDWKYPRDEGFAHNAKGQVRARMVTLHAGRNVLLDRFGAESGRFLSPAGTKYGKRAIPPSNLNTIDPRYAYDYHPYRLARDIRVCAGPAAPAFEQPGGAIQYATSSSACKDTVRVSVGDLVGNGTLLRVKVPYTDIKAMKHKPPTGVKTTVR